MKEVKDVREQALKKVLEQSSFVTNIQKTKNYEMFGYLKGNRSINPTNLSKIMTSIGEKHIETNAVICALDLNDEEKPLKIIDGQHRFEACVKLKKDVTFVIDDSIDMNNINQVLSDITLMNTASREWDVNDFLRSEMQKGNPNYVLYGEVFLKFKDHFDHEGLFFILNEKPGRMGKKLGYPLFKIGGLNFTEEHKEYLEDRLTELSLFNEYSELGGKRYFQKALNSLINSTGFSSSTMLKKLNQIEKKSIEKTTTIGGALNQLRDIHNKHQQKNKLWFSTSGGGKSEKIKIFVE